MKVIKKMLLIEYIILGILQGFTEPLPISSSGHLKIFKYIFKSNALNDMNFEIIVNFGSLIAIIILYRKEILNIIKDFFMYVKTKENIYKINYKYVWLIIVATIPAAVFGIFIKDLIENYFTIRLVGLMLIITSIILFKIRNLKGNKDKKDITYLDAFKIGLFQVFALLPGISRSGMTIAASMKCNLKRKEALDFSFMLYLPVSFGAIILGLFDLIKTQNISSLIPFYIISFIVSMITTYFSIKWFIKIVKKGKLIYFSIYCFIIGILTIIFI